MRATLNPDKRIQKRRSEVEMRKALATLSAADIDLDAPFVVLQDCIEELLESRALLEEIRGFVSVWHAKFNRR